MGKPKKFPRISKYYSLVGTQATFDFVDVRTLGDTALFIDPVAIAKIESPWTNACTSSIQSFFQRVIDAISASDDATARALLRPLGEDNSTRLGYSSASKGSGLGNGLAEAFFVELSGSEAVKTGLIRDLEDTALLIEGVREDRISDVVTNIIRNHLIDYTQTAARYYNIPLVNNVSMGPFWDVAMGMWVDTVADLPFPKNGGPLLLVPKSIVRRSLACDPGKYYRHHVLQFFQQQELATGSPLVQVLKSGAHRVTKRSVEEKYHTIHDAGTHNPGVEKRINLDATNQNPDLLERFKTEQKAAITPTSPNDIAEATGTLAADFASLLAKVLACQAGSTDASSYERAVEALFSALFYPALVNPIRQEKIHDGRKQLDISFTNAAQDGFFYWLANHYSAANIVVECKNYATPIKNPEQDQISGRYSPSRGKVGLLVYRHYEGKDRLLESCRDTAKDDRGFTIPLDDVDLSSLVDEALEGDACGLGGLMRERFRYLTS